jgi:regulator of cell morphogenesis and NO signaling
MQVIPEILQIKSQTPVGNVVAANFKAAAVLSTLDIDFCCNGGMSLEAACKKKGLDVDEVIYKLNKALAQPPEKNYSGMLMSELIDEIVNLHHSYVEATMPIINAYLNKLCSVHGHHHPELFEIADTFLASSRDLAVHMKKEELVLFPFIKALEKARANGTPMPSAHFGDIHNPIAMMMEDHQVEGGRFASIATLSKGYACPADGCQTYRVAMGTLAEFEQDLHKHIHLENNILFPKAQTLYKEMTAKI